MEKFQSLNRLLQEVWDDGEDAVKRVSHPNFRFDEYSPMKIWSDPWAPETGLLLNYKAGRRTAGTHGPSAGR